MSAVSPVARVQTQLSLLEVGKKRRGYLEKMDYSDSRDFFFFKIIRRKEEIEISNRIFIFKRIRFDLRVLEIFANFLISNSTNTF